MFLNDVQLVATLRFRAPLWVCGDIFDCFDFGSRKSTSGSKKRFLACSEQGVAQRHVAEKD